MKYTINGYSQEKLIEYNIDLSSSLILRVIADMYTSNAKTLEYKMLDDDKYMWCTYGYLLEQIPILGTERTLIRKVDSLIEKNILKKIILPQRKGKTGRYLYISLGENYHSLTEYNSNDKMSSEQMTKCQECSDKMSFDLMTKCHDKDSSISDSSITISSSTHDAHEEKEVEVETQPILVDYQKKKKEKEELKAKIDEYKTLVSKATGEEKAKIDLVLKPYVYMPHLDQLLEKIKASKFLLGEKEQKPSLRIFAYKTNEIIAGIYDDFEKKQTAETKKTKTRNFNPDNPYDTRTPEQIEKDRREQEEFERAIGIL